MFLMSNIFVHVFFYWKRDLTRACLPMYFQRKILTFENVGQRGVMPNKQRVRIFVWGSMV